MPKLRVHNVAISLDGYGAGPNQSVENPLGEGGEGLHEWMFETRTWQRRQGDDGGDERLDDGFMAAGTPASAPRSWGATCSARSVAAGVTRTGRGGGATSRRTTTTCSCSRTTRSADPDGGRHDVPLRRPTGSRSALERAFDAAGGQRRPARRRRRDDPAVPPRRAGRRAARRDRADPARRRGAALRPPRRRDRPLRVRRARQLASGRPCPLRARPS